MKLAYVIEQLQKNKLIVKTLLENTTTEEYLWKQSPDKWNLLEIICHLYDEEIEDFRTRTTNVIETPDQRPPSFDPVAWVTERNYAAQNFAEKLSSFLREREKSITYLSNLKDPNLTQGYEYADFGYVDGSFFLTNWIAHDYLHIKQIVRLKYDYATHIGEREIAYAGKWT